MSTPRRRPARRARLIAGLVAIGLVGSACATGSDDNAVEGTIETTAPTAPAAPSADAASDPVLSTEEPSTPASTAAPEATEAPPETEAVAPTEAPAPEPTAPPPTEAPAPVAPEALGFTAPLVGGGEIDLAANFTGKPTLMWFWAPF